MNTWFNKITNWIHIVVPLVIITLFLILSKFGCSVDTKQQSDTFIESPSVRIQSTETNQSTLVKK